MLKKKGGSAFKPKAAIRRNVPAAPGRQSKTPAPAPSSTSDQVVAVAESTPIESVTEEAAAKAPVPVPTSVAATASSASSAQSVATPTPGASQEVPRPSSPLEQRQITQPPSQPTIPSHSGHISGRRSASHSSQNAAPPTAASNDVIQLPTATQREGSHTSQPPAKSAATVSQPTLAEAFTQHPEVSSEAVAQQSVPQPDGPPIPTVISEPNISADDVASGTSSKQSRKRKTLAANGATSEPPQGQSDDTGPPVKKARPTRRQEANKEASAVNNVETAAPRAQSKRRQAPVRSARASHVKNGISNTAESTGVQSEAAATNRKRGRPRKSTQDAVPAAGAEQEANGGGESATRASNRRPRTRAQAEPSPTNDEQGSAEDEGQEEDQDENQDESEPESSAKPQKGRKSKPRKERKERSVTPEDAEEREVDPKFVTMAELTKDLRIGKKFSRHDELVARMRELGAMQRLARKLKNRAANGEPAVSGGEGDGEEEEGVGSMAADGGGDSNGNGSGPRASREKSTPASTSTSSAATPLPQQQQQQQQPAAGAATASLGATRGPQFEIIDGNIVINQASLVHDRHAAAAASRSDFEVVEENEFTRMTNSSTYLRPGKLRGPNAWNEEETALFYDYLRMFGTDFQTIANMFPGRTRRHVKMKFNREEKHHPAKVNAAIVGRKQVMISLDEYQSRTGDTLEATAVIEEEHRRREEAHEAEQRRIQDEAEAAQREKREKLLGGGPGKGGEDPGGDGVGVAGKGKSKSGNAGPGSGASPGAGPGGDDEEEDVEIIDEAEIVRPPRRRRTRAGGIWN